MRLVVYGAQGMALGAYRAVKELFPDQEILCFLVSEMGANASIIEGVPVMELNGFLKKVTQDERKDIQVLIGTPENVMEDIEETLEKAGIHNHVRLDSFRWAELTRNAFLKSGNYLPLAAYLVGCNRARLHIFKMIHFHDKPLKTQYQDPEYIITLQVGADGSLRIDTDFHDNKGDSISERNGNYSELTGLYWMWKNYLRTRNDDDYYGLAHYRRLLDLSDDDILRLKDNDIDVVLPYPMPYDPSMEAHHRRYLSDNEWRAVLTALGELCPQYTKEFEEILGQEYFYNYNILLAKRKVLDAYCNWLFPLLFKIEEMNDQDGRKAPNRFIGYVGETLETLYFMYHKHNLRIAYTGIRFLT